MKLWVDDIRNAPNEIWSVARTSVMAIRFINRFKESMTEISLDHDISHQVSIGSTLERPFPCEETFQSVAYYIAAVYSDDVTRSIPIPKITIHSSNPMGGKEMQAILAQAGIKSEFRPMGAANRLEMHV